MKNLGTWTEESHINRTQGIEERISVTEDKTEEMVNSVKEIIKTKHYPSIKQPGIVVYYEKIKSTNNTNRGRKSPDQRTECFFFKSQKKIPPI